MPLMRWSRLSAVRSALKMAAASPCTVAIGVPGSTGSPSAMLGMKLALGIQQSKRLTGGPRSRQLRQDCFSDKMRCRVNACRADRRQSSGVVERGVFIECRLDDATDMLARERSCARTSALTGEEFFEHLIRKVDVREHLRDVVEFLEFGQGGAASERLGTSRG